MRIYDFDDCAKQYKFYGGKASRKISVVFNNELWMLKFPKSTKDFSGCHLSSYTSSPLSEYIATKIYQSLDIPAHDVLLGVRENKVVIACKDFATEDPILEFSYLKNSISEENLDGSTNSSNSHGEPIQDVINTLEHLDLPKDIKDGLSIRFWQMFVVDALVLNNNRNNGNWGIITRRYSIDLAPVYDNGNAFFNKRTDPVIERRLQSSGNIINDLNTSVSFFTDMDGYKIHPFDFMRNSATPELNDAIAYVMSRFDQMTIDSIIDEIPESCKGLSIISEHQKEYYKTIVRTGYSNYLVPIAQEKGIHLGREADRTSDISFEQHIEAAKESSLIQSRLSSQLADDLSR